MRDLSLWVAPIAVPLILLASCSRGEKPDAFVHAGLEALKGKPRAVWDALPPSYQKDTNDVIAAFAAKVPEKPWNDTFVVAGKLVKVLETKKTFVLGHPALQSSPMKPEDVAKSWDPAVHLLGSLVNSEIKTVAGLKAFDVPKFLDGAAAAMFSDALNLSSSAGASMPAPGAAKLADLRTKLASVKVTVVSSSDDKASVKIEAEGEQPQTIEMVKIENKWIPKDFADQWPLAIASAKAAISTIEVPPEMIAQFDAMKGKVEPVLDGLLTAETQEAFNTQLDTFMAGMMGRPSEPPAGLEPGAEAAAEPAPPAEPAPTKAAKKVKKKKKSED
jgi:hypothetical protein